MAQVAVVHARESTAREEPRNAARHLWGLEWPAWSSGGISCELVSFEEVLPFIAQHYPSIFGAHGGRFLEERMTPAKRRFLDEGDTFAFRAGGATVGICLAHPTDWSTYYIRSYAMLPEYRERRFSSDFSGFIDGPLREAGVQRIEADCSPANVPMNRLFVATGWVVTATLNSERWGTMLRYTRFLSPEAAGCFRQQYVQVPAFGKPVPESGVSVITPNGRRSP